MTTKEKIGLARIKANLAAEEVGMINLEIDEKPVIGLNYGLIMHNREDSIKKTYKGADEIMSEDKHKMYVKNNLERRK